MGADVELPLRRIQATLTVDASGGNYTAGDVVGNDDTASGGDPLTVENIAAQHGKVITIYGITAICSEDSVTFRPRLHFFDAVPAAADVEMDDNAAFAITTSTNYLGAVDLPAFADEGGVATTYDHALRFFAKVTNETRDLYVVVEALDAETNETAGMTIRFDFYVP